MIQRICLTVLALYTATSAYYGKSEFADVGISLVPVDVIKWGLPIIGGVVSSLWGKIKLPSLGKSGNGKKLLELVNQLELLLQDVDVPAASPTDTGKALEEIPALRKYALKVIKCEKQPSPASS